MTTLFIVAGYFGLAVGAICAALVVSVLFYLIYEDYVSKIIEVEVRAGAFRSGRTNHLWTAEVVHPSGIIFIAIENGNTTYGNETDAQQAAYCAAIHAGWKPIRVKSSWWKDGGCS